MSKFNQLGLLQQASLIEKAKELGDKKRLIKEGLKERLQRPSEGDPSVKDGVFPMKYKSASASSSLSDQILKDSFAKKLDKGEGYICTCCNQKFPDQMQASKHFNLSSEHKEQKAEQFKKLIEQRVAEKKEQLRLQKQREAQEQELQRSSQIHSSIQQERFMLVQEEEIIEEEEEEEEEDSQKQSENAGGDELARLEQLDRIQSEQQAVLKQNEKRIQAQNSKMLESLEEVKDEKENSQEQEADHEEEYQERLIDDLDEVERLYNQIEQKKKQLVGQKRSKKANLLSLIDANGDEDGDFESLLLNNKRR